MVTLAGGGGGGAHMRYPPATDPGSPAPHQVPGHAAAVSGMGGTGGLSLPRPLSPPRGPDIFKRRIFPTRLSSCQECASRNAQGPSKNNFQT